MLWDIIRDFIVQYITGGIDSQGTPYNVLFGTEGDGYGSFSGNEYYVAIGGRFDSTEPISYISASDWLATTLTIIAMCLLVAFAIWLVRWVFKAVSSAFLLRR